MSMPLSPSAADKMDQWGLKQEQAKNSKPSRIQTMLLSIIAGVGSLLINLAALPYAVSSAYILKRIFTKTGDKPIEKAIHEMRTEVEKAKFVTLQSVLESYSKQVDTLTEGIENSLANPMMEKQRIAREILRFIFAQEEHDPLWTTVLTDRKIVRMLELNSSGEFAQENIRKLLDKIKKNYPVNTDVLVSIDWKALAKQVRKDTIASTNIENETAKFKAALSKIVKILEIPKENSKPHAHNIELTKALREALNTPVYQALKHNPRVKSIQFLHRLASDIWNKVPAMQAYSNVGQKIIEETFDKARGKIRDSIIKKDHEKFADVLQQSHKEMQNLYFHQEGDIQKISYAISHPKQTLDSLASEGGLARTIPAAVGRQTYDPHLLSNNPSLQGVTHLKFNGKREANINQCYGGSPTIGDHQIAPEFEAVIQAAENNQLYPASADKNIPMFVNYNNLQNLDKSHGESPRSQAIMLLNKKYPLSFQGITLAKDSNIYMMPKEEDIRFRDPESFGNVMLEQLMNSFDPRKTGHGFYFHGSREKWEPIFNAIIDNANTYFKWLHDKGINNNIYARLGNKGLQGAYQEYVYSLLQVAIEIESAKKLMARGISNPTIMFIASCKEDIDRGGMENAKLLYLRLDPDLADRDNLIVGAMYGRALDVRDRLILEKRIEQPLNFMRAISPDQFQVRVNLLCKELYYNVKSQSYEPNVPPPPPPPLEDDDDMVPPPPPEEEDFIAPPPPPLEDDDDMVPPPPPEEEEIDPPLPPPPTIDVIRRGPKPPAPPLNDTVLSTLENVHYATLAKISEIRLIVPPPPPPDEEEDPTLPPPPPPEDPPLPPPPPPEELHKSAPTQAPLSRRRPPLPPLPPRPILRTPAVRWSSTLPLPPLPPGQSGQIRRTGQTQHKPSYRIREDIFTQSMQS